MLLPTAFIDGALIFDDFVPLPLQRSNLGVFHYGSRRDSVYVYPHDETNAMSRRINVSIDDDTWRLLEKIPSGERSRTINQALRIWAQRRRRRDAVAEHGCFTHPASQVQHERGCEVDS